MRAAAERPVGVNQTASGLAFKQRTDTIGEFWQFLAPRGAKTFGSDECLAFGKLRRQPGELKLTALGARLARAFQRPLCQFRINRPDFTNGVLYFFPQHAG